MLSLASVHLRNFLANALNYLQIKPAQQTSPFLCPDQLLTHTHRIDLRDLEQSDAACLSPASQRPARTTVFMRRELEFTRTELARTKTDVAMLEDRCKMLEKTLKDTRDILRAREAEVEKVRKERDRERKLSERRRSDSMPRLQPKDTVHPRHSSVDIRSQHPNGRSAAGKSSAKAGHPPALPATTAAAPRTPAVPNNSLSAAEDRARQRSAEAYLTRTDSWSGAQVIQALHDINSEILQFAASATEVCIFAPTPDARAILSSRSAQAMHDTTSRLGPKFARILSSRDHSQDPLLVQWALQGCIALCVARALSTFCFGFPAEADNILSQIYRRMSLAEPQPTSSKWRALTHRNIHAVFPTLDGYATQKLTDTIVRWSADIFLISGCTSIHDMSSPSLSFATPTSSRSLSTQPSFASLASSSTSTASIGNGSASLNGGNATTQLRESLKTHFGDQIRRVARTATRLATTLREEILSTSFDVIAMDHTQTFDPATMYDYMAPHAQQTHAAGGGGATATGGNGGSAVLATTELGLLCTTRIGNRESVGDEDVTIEKRLLLKPKVVLENVLEMLDR